jgi:hypothetical protein
VYPLTLTSLCFAQAQICLALQSVSFFFTIFLPNKENREINTVLLMALLSVGLLSLWLHVRYFPVSLLRLENYFQCTVCNEVIVNSKVQNCSISLGARFSAPVQTGPGAHPGSYTRTMVTWSFPGVKRTGRGFDHPPHLAPRLKHE